MALHGRCATVVVGANVVGACVVATEVCGAAVVADPSATAVATAVDAGADEPPPPHAASSTAAAATPNPPNRCTAFVMRARLGG